MAPTCKKLTPIVIHNLKNPPAGAVNFHFVAVVAFADVGPVGDVDAAVGAVFAVEAAEPGVAREGEVGGVVSDVAAAVGLERVAVEPLPVDVEHEGLVAVFGGPVVAEVDHAAAVGVSAAEVVVLLAAAGGGPVAAGQVLMV